MLDPRLTTDRLELRPLPAAAAAALPDDRVAAMRVLGAALPEAWPQPDLLDVLPMQAAAGPDAERFGVWVMIELETNTVIGDIGFMGPPDADGSVEVGYSVVPDRRARGFATEAAVAMLGWALREPDIRSVVARCDVDNEPSIRTLERAGFTRTAASGDELQWRADAWSERLGDHQEHDHDDKGG